MQKSINILKIIALVLIILIPISSYAKPKKKYKAKHKVQKIVIVKQDLPYNLVSSKLDIDSRTVQFPIFQLNSKNYISSIDFAKLFSGKEYPKFNITEIKTKFGNFTFYSSSIFGKYNSGEAQILFQLNLPIVKIDKYFLIPVYSLFESLDSLRIFKYQNSENSFVLKSKNKKDFELAGRNVKKNVDKVGKSVKKDNNSVGNDEENLNNNVDNKDENLEYSQENVNNSQNNVDKKEKTKSEQKYVNEEDVHSAYISINQRIKENEKQTLENNSENQKEKLAEKKTSKKNNALKNKIIQEEETNTTNSTVISLNQIENNNSENNNKNAENENIENQNTVNTHAVLHQKEIKSTKKNEKDKSDKKEVINDNKYSSKDKISQMQANNFANTGSSDVSNEGKQQKNNSKLDSLLNEQNKTIGIGYKIPESLIRKDVEKLKELANEKQRTK